MFSSGDQLHKTQILYICFISVLSHKSQNKTRYCILLRFNFNCNQNPGETKFNMFGQYGPVGLEPPAWRIVHSIRVVLFTNVKMEPPLHRTVSKVYHFFLWEWTKNNKGVLKQSRKTLFIYFFLGGGKPKFEDKKGVWSKVFFLLKITCPPPSMKFLAPSHISDWILKIVAVET